MIANVRRRSVSRARTESGDFESRRPVSGRSVLGIYEKFSIARGRILVFETNAPLQRAVRLPRGRSRSDPALLDQDHCFDIAQRHTRHRSEEHTSELQSHVNLVCRLLLEKKKE